MTAAHSRTDVLAAVLAWHDAGCCVIPAATDGTKQPALSTWKSYQYTRPDRGQVQAWFAGGHPGVGVITGSISGNLEMLELEGRAVEAGMLGELRDLALASGLAELWRKVTVDGYLERSPGGGIHLLYRLLEPVAGNTKLAQRPATDDELADWQARERAKATATIEDPDRLAARLTRIEAMTCVQVPQGLAETRGEGGYVVVAPSNGTTHPSGRAWVRAAGRPDTIPDLSAAEHEALWLLFRTLDRMPEPAVEATPRPPPTDRAPQTDADRFLLTGRQDGAGLSPGDDFNARQDWADILEPHGWTLVRARGTERFWLRPGKTGGGRDSHSATTGYGDRGDWLWVFSSSTEFDTETTYSKFAAHALLEHAGDYKAAAGALRAAGYGREPTLTASPAPAPPAPAVAAPEPDDGHTQIPAEVSASDPTSHAGLTDSGNADLLVARHGHEIRYVPERAAWLCWVGTHWKPDAASLVMEHAKDTVLAIPTGDDALRKHRTRSLSRGHLESMVSLARSRPDIIADADKLDADPYALCTPGGVVDLRTGMTTPACPDQLHTRITSVPAHDTPTPRWDAFLADTFAGDLEVLQFVQRLAGYSCTGVAIHHVLPFLHGTGGNGKSVFLDVVRRLLGDYAATAPAGFLLGGQQQHETEIARLAGLRFVICSEVNQDAKFDEAKVKLLTGGDALTARFMHKDHFTFAPSHHLWLMGNHQPRIAAGGDGFRRRLRLIPFTHKVEDAKRVDGLDVLLSGQEGPGILAWLVRGAQDALHGGLRAPSSVLAATQVYMEEEDTLARYVDERCHLTTVAPGTGSPLRTSTADVRQDYESWCRREGEVPLPPQVLGRELRTRFNVSQARSHGRRFYTGMTLLTDQDEPADQHWSDR